MSDRTFKPSSAKGATAFLNNRFAQNKNIQNGTNKRYQKEIEYFRDDAEPNALGLKPHDPRIEPKNWRGKGSEFHANNQGFDMEADKNYSNITSTVAVPTKFKSNAELRIATPGFRENDATYHDFVVKFVAEHQGLQASEGLSNRYVKILQGEQHDDFQATLLKVNGGTKPLMYGFDYGGVTLTVTGPDTPLPGKIFGRKKSVDDNDETLGTMYAWENSQSSEDYIYTNTLQIVVGQSGTIIYRKNADTGRFFDDSAEFYPYQYGSGSNFLHYNEYIEGEEFDVVGWKTNPAATSSSYYTVVTYDDGYDYLALAGEPLYSDSACANAVGEVEALFVTYDSTDSTKIPGATANDNQFFGFMRSKELDCVVNGVPYYGWTYLLDVSKLSHGAPSDFSQVWTSADGRDISEATHLYLLDARTSEFREFCEHVKVATWSCPPIMLDIEGEYEYSNIKEFDAAKGNSINGGMVQPIYIGSTTITLNMRGLLTYYVLYHSHPCQSFKIDTTVHTSYPEGPYTYTGTTMVINDETMYEYKYEQGTTVVKAYTYDRLFSWLSPSKFMDADGKTLFDSPSGSEHAADYTFDSEDFEMVAWQAYANTDDDVFNPYTEEAYAMLDYSTTNRDSYNILYGEDIPIDNFIKEKYYVTSNAGFAEVSSQTTLYNESVYRYKDFDAYAKAFAPSDWETAYGAVVIANSSKDYDNYRQFIAICPSDFFSDGQEIRILIPKSSDLDYTQPSSYDSVRAYIYSATRQSIYSTIFEMNETGVNAITTETGTYDRDSTLDQMKGSTQMYGWSTGELQRWTITASPATDSALWAKASGVWTEVTTIEPITRVDRETHVYHYVSDATRNYWCNEHNCQVFHFASKESLGYDLYTRKLDYTIDDLFFLRNEVEIPITEIPGLTYSLTSFGTFPYAHFFYDDYLGRYTCAWYDGDTYTTHELKAFSATSEGSTSYYCKRREDSDAVNEGKTMYAWWCNAEYYYTTSLLIGDAGSTVALWSFNEETKVWTSFEATISTKEEETNTWYKFFINYKYSWTDSTGTSHCIYDAIWASSRNAGENATLCYSTYTLDGSILTCTPALSDTFGYKYRYALYIAPAFAVAANVSGKSFELYATYDEDNYEYNGILYSGWSLTGSKTVYYTARVTPRVGDNVYLREEVYSEELGYTIYTLNPVSGITVEKVTSVVDILYPERLPVTE